ncbi:MAG: alpha/beta hydrolase [Betaproteobacteria bacterium]|nr:alpha/beta hydrolase [Betaproteobacteria bacterium]MBM3385458.1 alpha/beta hydrolase [Betaproteobacteria bacterium]
MPAQSRREFVAGAAGRIECAVDEPEGGASRGVALLAHPHPLYGGTLDNKVAQALARAFVELGYAAWRPNFRGVGRSEGVHDQGRGELEDLLAVLNYAGAQRPALAGFSFGAGLVAQAAKRVEAERLVLVGLAVNRLAVPPVPADTIVIHGELDTTVPLVEVLDWARPQELPVVVIPGADHFFHRRLALLRALVKGSWK